ncbi:MAG TPA: hypothetical protein VFA30_06500 [Gaiellaceae bacterium]|nr:hypothetical protein [Gaiellaceae bacterium]
MRALVLALAVAAALLAAPLAGASIFPGVFAKGPKVVAIAPYKPIVIHTCAAQSKSRTAIGKASRSIHPVACEQPPRSNALDGQFVVGFGF